MVNYKGMLLARNSDAYSLWEKKEFEKLDKHLKEVNSRYYEVLKRYEHLERK